MANKDKTEEYDSRYENFENRIFRLSGWVVALIGIFATFAIGISIAQMIISQNTIEKLNEADKNNTLLVKITLAATPNARVKAISEAIDSNPDNAELYYCRAITNYTRFPPEDIPDEMIDLIYEDCTVAITKKSNYADAYYLKGEILFNNRRNYAEAYEIFSKAFAHKNELTVDVSQGDLYRYLGLSSFKMNNYKRTVQYLKDISKSNLESMDSGVSNYTLTVGYALANSYELLGDFDEAINSYSELISNTDSIEQKLEICDIIIAICEKENEDSMKNAYLDIKEHLRSELEE